MRFARLSVLSLLLLSLCVTLGLQSDAPPGSQMKMFAETYLASLDAEQRENSVLPYDSPKRVGWHFIPKDNRKGLKIGDMNDAQRTSALRLLRAALSEAGYSKATRIMKLEQVLAILEGDGRRWARDPDKYFLTIFGQPSNTESWGMSFEGHHLSLNFVCRGGKIVDSTPQFMGANPATIMTGVEGATLSKGTRVLRDEEQLAFDLVNSLEAQQAERAMIAEEAFDEIRFAGEAQVAVGKPEGIAYSALNPDQQELLKQLVHTYTNAVPEEVAKRRRELIQSNGWNDVHFAWAGANKPGVGHYYRIRGQAFLIEFVNTQPDAAGNPANHIHAVFRDLEGDFDLPADQQ